ncbi:MAG: DUF748 domain-containing protein [Gallionella sp.]|jgi:hypothetical protein
MNLRLPSRRKILLAITGLVVSWLLFAWLAIPRIIQSQAEGFVAQKSGHHLTMDRPKFNPFELRLQLSGLHLAQPDGKPLLAFRELELDLSARSLTRGTLVFDSVHLDGLEADVALLANGKMNWSALIDAFKSPESTAPLPRFEVHRLVLSGSRLDFADHRVKPAFVTRFEPVDLVFTDLSSLAGVAGQYELSARTSSGARLSWSGQAGLEPLAATGSFNVEEVNLATLAAYLKDGLPLVPSAGMAGVSANYRIGYAKGRLEVVLDRMQARLTGLRLQQNAGPLVTLEEIEAKGGRFDLAKNSFALDKLSMTGGSLDLLRGRANKALELSALSVDDVRINLAAHHATLGRVALKSGHIRMARDAQGRIDILDALKAVSPDAQVASDLAHVKSASRKSQAKWRYRVEKLDVAGFEADLMDESVAPAAQLAVQDIALSLSGISDDLTVAVPLKASFALPDGGNFAAEGAVVPLMPTADIKFKLADLALKPAQPYLSTLARLKIAGGRLSVEGRAGYGSEGAVFKGGFAVRDLQFDEAETGNLFLAWKFLGGATVDLTQKKLDIDELVLDGLDGKLIINKDKTLSFKRILKPAAPAVPSSFAQSASPRFLVNIDRLRFDRGEMDFADYSLALPFGTRILDLKGVISGLSNRRGAQGHIELDGQVDEYGLARAVGQINLRDPADFLDLKVIFRNIEMSRLTPYAATFAGRRINSGKLSLDLEYKIKQRQLEGKNQVIMDKLMLGERVSSPEAHDLPLDLAISILQDSDGRIDLGLPMSGSLDDPKFSFGSLVWKAISNVLSGIVTAPFRALGALFGGGDKFENIVFDAGSAHLTPPEREKLLRLAEALAKRPTLTISVHGVYADTDRFALQDLQLRRSVSKMSAQHVEEGEDPGPIATHQPKVQAALEALFSDRFGGGELAALKEGFRRANPGQLEESIAGRLTSTLTGLFREKRVLSDQEVSKLKGADFYTVLFERLRSAIEIDDKQLLTLAAMRAEAAAAALKEDGAAADHVSVLQPEKVEAGGRDVPLKLVLGTRSVVPAN